MTDRFPTFGQMTGPRSRVTGCGAALPARRVSNAELTRTVDTSDEWIIQRTGIRERRVAAVGETTSNLAIAAARSALARAGMTGADLDLIIVGTTTPDQTLPATAVHVQAALEMHHGAAFDVQAACSGFIYALSVADNMIRLGQVRNALVIGAETLSRILDWTDRDTCVLFGDGAGAVVLKSDQAEPGTQNRGILSTHLHSDGRHRDKIQTDGGASSTQTVGVLHMLGREVFFHASVNLTAVAKEALRANGLQPADIDWFVPHQANQRIIAEVGRQLGLPNEKVVVTLPHHANTSAASIPLALAEAAEDGRIKPGDLILIAALGAGLTWGGAVIRW
jgi:3-oxoacyl-[acyl-carrier-protein] synthase-3